MAITEHLRQLFAIKKIRSLALVAEEEPIPAGRSSDLPLLQKRAERRDTRSRADHNNWPCRVLRQPEAVGRLNVNRRRGPNRQSLRQKDRADSFALASAAFVSQRAHRDMNFVWVSFGTRRNRVEPRLQLFEETQ